MWTDKDREVPGFPVRFVGVDKLHAAFLNESRTRGRCLVPLTGNPGVWFSLEENHEKPVAPRISFERSTGQEQRCATFFAESRVQFGSSNNIYRKSGVRSTPIAKLL
jgi:hypothetical protein